MRVQQDLFLISDDSEPGNSCNLPAVKINSSSGQYSSRLGLSKRKIIIVVSSDDEIENCPQHVTVCAIKGDLGLSTIQNSQIPEDPILPGQKVFESSSTIETDSHLAHSIFGGVSKEIHLRSVKEREKAATAALKIQAKELKAQARAEAAELKAAENKANKDSKTANKIRQKLQCTVEMTVNICNTFNESYIPELSTELVAAGAQVITSSVAKIPGCITWIRRRTRRWNLNDQEWQPCVLIEEDEPFVLVYLTASQVALMASTPNGIVKHCQKIRQIYDGFEVIYLIEDLSKFFKSYDRQQKLILNRKFREAMTGEKIPLSKASHPAQSREEIEKQILELQFFKGSSCKVNYCQKSKMHIWIRTFTEQIAFAPELKYFAV